MRSRLWWTSFRTSEPLLEAFLVRLAKVHLEFGATPRSDYLDAKHNIQRLLSHTSPKRPWLVTEKDSTNWSWCLNPHQIWFNHFFSAPLIDQFPCSANNKVQKLVEYQPQTTSTRCLATTLITPSVNPSVRGWPRQQLIACWPMWSSLLHASSRRLLAAVASRSVAFNTLPQCR